MKGLFASVTEGRKPTGGIGGGTTYCPLDHIDRGQVELSPDQAERVNKILSERWWFSPAGWLSPDELAKRQNENEGYREQWEKDHAPG